LLWRRQKKLKNHSKLLLFNNTSITLTNASRSFKGEI